MDKLPQSADELLSWLIGLLPEFLQPYAGFVFTLIVVTVGVLTFFQPVIDLFRRKEDAPASTGEAALDALLALDARGKLGGADREQLTVALLTRITQVSGQSALEDQGKRDAIERLVDSPASAEKSDTLNALLTDPANALEDMLETATTADDYVDIGILAMGVHAATAQIAFERALALDPDHLDANYHILRLRELIDGAASVAEPFEALLPKAEHNRPDLTALILLKLARIANKEDRWQDALRQYRRAISIAEATHDKEQLAAACHASADDLLSTFRPLRKIDPEDLPLGPIEQAEEMLDKAQLAIDGADAPLPQAEIKQLLLRANIAQIKSEFDTADALVRQAIELAHDNTLRMEEANALALQAIIQHKTFHMFAAVDTIDEAIQMVETVLDGLDVDSDIPNAALLKLKGDLLLESAQFDDALEFYRRAFDAFSASAGFDPFGRDELENLIFQCRLNGSESFSEEEMQAARDELETLQGDDAGNEDDPVFDLDKRMREMKLAQMTGDLDEPANMNDDTASSEPFFSAEEDEILEQASKLFASGLDRFKNEDWENARFALERSRELLNDIDALTAETDDQITQMLSVCSANGA